MATCILGIESSCDDTAAAVMIDGQLKTNLVANQKIHEQYGGVVPELASRAHQKNILPVVDQALEQAGIGLKDLSAIAFTRGPGLLGSLLVGGSFAKGLALGLNIPLIGVHHMKAHILAHFIEDPKPSFPFLCLTVSGGHTQIVRVDGPLDMTVLGQTLDDAAGEAFDKSAKLLGLSYPGGPLVDKHAAQGDPNRFEFSKPAIEGLNFSFSGLKTSVLYFLRKEQKKNPDFAQENIDDLCASIQQTIIVILLGKLRRAARETGINQVSIAGGVSANRGLRQALQDMAQKEGWETYIPAFPYCTDNAAMIAMTGHYLYEAGAFDKQTVSSLPRFDWNL